MNDEDICEESIKEEPGIHSEQIANFIKEATIHYRD